MGVGLTKGRVKKNWNFPDLVRPTLVIAEIWKKNVSCHTLYGWHNGWCSPHDTWCSQQSVRCGQHDVWCGRQDAYEVWWVGQNQCHTSPPYMAKNKFHLNVYLGIFMHFESIFFIFLNLENGLFQTHPPTKSGKFDFFLTLPFISAYVAVQYFTVS